MRTFPSASNGVARQKDPVSQSSGMDTANSPLGFKSLLIDANVDNSPIFMAVTVLFVLTINLLKRQLKKLDLHFSHNISFDDLLLKIDFADGTQQLVIPKVKFIRRIFRISSCAHNHWDVGSVEHLNEIEAAFYLSGHLHCERLYGKTHKACSHGNGNGVLVHVEGRVQH